MQVPYFRPDITEEEVDSVSAVLRSGWISTGPVSYELENQFKNYYLKAKTMKGKVGDNLLSLLERRLDNTVYSMGLGLSRSHARQMILHRKLKVNDKIVNIASFQVHIGDTINLVDKAKGAEINVTRLQDKDYKTPAWIDINKSTNVGKIIALPQREDITQEINENLIIEYYSR